MGVARGGIVFPLAELGVDAHDLVAAVFGADIAKLEPPPGDFDTRNSRDVVVKRIGDVLAILGGGLDWALLSKHEPATGALWDALRRPQVFVAFCRYDSGGSHGFGVFEEGQRVRSLLHTPDS